VRGILRGLLVGAAAVLAAAALFAAFTVPPAAVVLDQPISDRVVFGAYHVHSSRSDGTGSPDAIAAAAAAAGLRFVVLTDHGDATRRPDPPAYLRGVLILDAVEVNTDAGHVVALGLDEPSPFPLAGGAEDVVDDIHRLGGWAVLAHPDSPDQDLRWRGAGSLSADGIEWFNADSEWRDEPASRIAATAVRSLIRPAESITGLFERPARSLQRWDSATRSRPVVGLAAVDAHGGVMGIAGYRAMFGTVAQGIALPTPLSGDAAADAAAILAALRAGRTFSIVRALAAPAALDFRALGANGESADMGGMMSGAARVTFDAGVAQAPGVRLDLFRNGQVVATGRGHLEHAGPVAPGAYRVEATFPGSALPWIVSNPIYVGIPAQRSPAAESQKPGEVLSLPADGAWAIERDPSSLGQVAVEDGALRFTYQLGGGEPSGQYAALVTAVEGNAGYESVAFTARSATPMRLSVQLRLPGGQDGLRWRRSVYVGPDARRIVVRLEDLEPVGGPSSQRPIVARVQAVLFVVDTINAKPGQGGEVVISGVGLGIGNTGGSR
jgi:hypothetical protein